MKCLHMEEGMSIRNPVIKEIRKDFFIHSPFPIPNSQFKTDKGGFTNEI